MNAYSELPLGFGIALAENPRAGRAFEALSAQQQKEFWPKHTPYPPSGRCRLLCKAWRMGNKRGYIEPQTGEYWA